MVQGFSTSTTTTHLPVAQPNAFVALAPLVRMSPPDLLAPLLTLRHRKAPGSLPPSPRLRLRQQRTRTLRQRRPPYPSPPPGQPWRWRQRRPFWPRQCSEKQRAGSGGSSRETGVAGRCAATYSRSEKQTHALRFNRIMISSSLTIEMACCHVFYPC